MCFSTKSLLLIDKFSIEFHKGNYEYSVGDSATGGAIDDAGNEYQSVHPIEVEPTDSQETRHSNRSQNESDKKWFACDECNKSFAQLSTLETHKKAIHLGIRPYACEQCERRFVFKSNLDRHSITQTGDQPYTCDQCGKASGLLVYLKRHERVVHELQRRFVCQQCGKRFNSPSDLNRHTVIHTGNDFTFLFDAKLICFDYICLYFMRSTGERSFTVG